MHFPSSHATSTPHLPKPGPGGGAPKSSEPGGGAPKRLQTTFDSLIGGAGAAAGSQAFDAAANALKGDKSGSAPPPGSDAENAPPDGGAPSALSNPPASLGAFGPPMGGGGAAAIIQVLIAMANVLAGDKSGSAPPPGPGAANAPPGGGAPSAPGNPPASPGAAPDASVQAVLNGENTSVASPDDKAPAGMTSDKIKKLDGDLLGNLGNQDLQGKGGIEDLLAKKEGGKDAKSLDSDINVEWRVEKDLQAIKNETKADGTQVSPDERRNGRLDGMTGSGEAQQGTNAGDAQDFLLHDRKPSSLQTGGIYAKDDGTSKNPLEVFGSKIEKVADDAGNVIKGAFKGAGDFFDGIGKGVGDVFKGKLSDAGSDFVHGATSAVKDVADPVVKTASDVAHIVPVVGDAIGNTIDGAGKAIDHAADGADHAATDAFHGRFGDSVRDLVNAGQQSFSDISKPVINFASTVVNDTPLKNTDFGKGLTIGSNWVADKASQVYNSLSDTVAAPAEHLGDAGQHAMQGNWSAIGKDLQQGAESSAKLALTAAPLLIPVAGEALLGAEVGAEGAGIAGLSTAESGGAASLRGIANGADKLNTAHDQVNNLYQLANNTPNN